MDRINKLGKYFLVFILTVLVLSCTNKADKGVALVHNAAQKIHTENKADEALLLLKAIDVGLLSEAEYAYYILIQIRAWDVAGVNIAMSDTAAIKSRDYFIGANDAKKAALAYFTLGRIYEKQSSTVKALHNYLQADYWAAKANYTITNFNYSRIPYNTAVILCNDLKSAESVEYCDKALIAIDNENGHYSDKLYVLELKGTNYVYLKNIDSALIYYDKAEEIADKHNDKESKYRMTVGRASAITRTTRDYDKAKRECRRLLSTIAPNDSILRGHVYMVLSGVYLKTQQLDSSLYYVYEAKQLLANAELYLKIPLYYHLYSVERKNGNNAVANEFEEQYKQLKENKVRSEQAQLKEINEGESKKEARQVNERLNELENAWAAAHKQMDKIQILIYIVFACLALILIFILRERKLRIDGYEQYKKLKFFKETQMRNILQRDDLIRLHAWIEDTFDPSPFSKQLIAKVERMIPDAHWAQDPEMFSVNYRALLYNSQIDYPFLEELEYGALCLVCTGLYSEKERAEVLEVSLEHYRSVEKSIRYKFIRRGLIFEDIINQNRAEYNITPIDPTEYLSPRRYVIWWRKLMRMLRKIRHKDDD